MWIQTLVAVWSEQQLGWDITMALGGSVGCSDWHGPSNGTVSVLILIKG